MSGTENPFGYEDGRGSQISALRHVVAELPARIAGGVWNPEWRRVLLVGIGASHAALASPTNQLRAGGLAAFRADAGEFPRATEQDADVVIALSQSGRSRETVELASRVRAAGVATRAITNARRNPLVETVEASVTLGDFPDSRVSTVGFVVTYAALGMLADIAVTGAVDDRWARLPDLIETSVAAAAAELRGFAETSLATGAVDVVAAASQLTTAEAVALLLREGPLVPSAAYGTRAYLHGHMDCAGQGTAHIVIGDDRETRLACQLAEKHTDILVVGNGQRSLPRGVRQVTVPADLTACQRALVEVCVLQELISAVAAVRGNPVDDPAFVRQDTKISVLAEL